MWTNKWANGVNRGKRRRANRGINKKANIRANRDQIGGSAWEAKSGISRGGNEVYEGKN